MSEVTKPVFVVGSPRSGTSILTWSLGQHPNILPLEETNWISKFAIDLGSTYDLGAFRGDRSQLSAMRITQDEFYEHFGDAINELILRNKGNYAHRDKPHPFQKVRSPLDSKERWVDGTPEYSFYIYALLKLFPYAKFIHILRDVESVAKSLMNFSTVGASDFTEQAAYEKWLRAVRACIEAEQAFGSETVLLIKYRDFINTPEKVLRYCLEFLGEPFRSECLEPLQTKINSSEVPRDFSLYDANTDPRLREEAKQLSHKLLVEGSPKRRPHPAFVAKLERVFERKQRRSKNLWLGKK